MIQVLYEEERLDLYMSSSIVWIMKSGRIQWAADMAGMEKTRNSYRISVGKRSLGRPGKIWKDDTGEISCDDGRWMEQSTVHIVYSS
jgi:hypothetical protein